MEKHGPCDEFLECSRERRVPSALPRGTSVFGLSLVMPHKPLSYAIPIFLTWRDRDERISFPARLESLIRCTLHLHGINHIRSSISFGSRNVRPMQDACYIVAAELCITRMQSFKERKKTYLSYLKNLSIHSREIIILVFTRYLCSLFPERMEFAR